MRLLDEESFHQGGVVPCKMSQGQQIVQIQIHDLAPASPQEKLNCSSSFFATKMGFPSLKLWPPMYNTPKHVCETFKQTFPTLPQNACAVAVLPQFIEICGRKLDSCSAVLKL